MISTHKNQNQNFNVSFSVILGIYVHISTSEIIIGIGGNRKKTDENIYQNECQEYQY